MDRLRAGSPIYSRSHSGGGSSSGSSSPSMSPAHHRSSSSSAFGFSTVKRTQNLAARAANARLAQVMASQTAEDDDDGDDDVDARRTVDLPFLGRPARSSASGNGGGLTFLGRSARSASPSIGSSNGGGGGGASFIGRPTRSPSPSLGRNFVEHTPAVRSTSAGRTSMSSRQVTMLPPTRTSLRTASLLPPIEPPIDRRREKFQRKKTITMNIAVECRSHLDNVVPISTSDQKDKILSISGRDDIGHLNSRDTGTQREASALRDELDMLQEENENILEKLRLTEEKWEEAEARSRELEKQLKQ